MIKVTSKENLASALKAPISGSISGWLMPIGSRSKVYVSRVECPSPGAASGGEEKKRKRKREAGLKVWPAEYIISESMITSESVLH